MGTDPVLSVVPVAGVGGMLGIGAFVAALVGLISAPLLIRGYARKYLPPGDRRWGMFRNAGRISPLLLLVLVLSYGVSLLAALAIVAVGVVLAICAFNP